MKSKISSIMDTTKKKAGVALLCGALVTTIGAGTVLADNSSTSTSMLSKIETGVRNFSTDGGKTWSKKAPQGVTVSDKDGKFTIMKGILKDADGKGLMVKVENDVKSYSTDNGKTWSEKAPEGVPVSDKDGKFTIMKGILKDADGKGLMVKSENGVRTYSIDDGKTWSEDVPEGVTKAENGAVMFTNKDANI